MLDATMTKRPFLCMAAAAAAISVGAAQDTGDFFSSREPATRDEGDRAVTPVNQIVEPAGRQVYLPKLRPQALALSPDGRILVTSGKTHDLIVIDPVSARVMQEVLLPPDDASYTNRRRPPRTCYSRRTTGQLSFTGLIFSPGRVAHLSLQRRRQCEGLWCGCSASRSGVVFDPAAAGQRAAPEGGNPRRPGALHRWQSSLRGAESFQSRRGTGFATGAVLRSWDVGVAPYDVVVAGDKIYVSNWGGRRPDAGSVTGPAGRGTVVRVDAHGVASEGSVTVIDAKANRFCGKFSPASTRAPWRSRPMDAGSWRPTRPATRSASSTRVRTTWWRPFARGKIRRICSAPARMRLSLTRAENGFSFATAPRTRWRSSISKREPPGCGGLFPSDGFRAPLCTMGPALPFTLRTSKAWGAAARANRTARRNSTRIEYYGGISLVTEPGKKELQRLYRGAHWPDSLSAAQAGRMARPPGPAGASGARTGG